MLPGLSYQSESTTSIPVPGSSCVVHRWGSWYDLVLRLSNSGICHQNNTFPREFKYYLWWAWNLSQHYLQCARNVRGNCARIVKVYTQLELKLRLQWYGKDGELYNRWSVNLFSTGISQLSTFLRISMISFRYFFSLKVLALPEQKKGKSKLRMNRDSLQLLALPCMEFYSFLSFRDLNIVQSVWRI